MSRPANNKMVIERGAGFLQGEVTVPGDKSITHRAIFFSSLAHGTSSIRTQILGRDNFATLRIMRQLGVSISGRILEEIKAIADEEGFPDLVGVGSGCELKVVGRGLDLLEPTEALDCGNSGTTARLLLGILAGQSFSARLVGDESLSRRPFKRVAEPLALMGAKFSSHQLPLTITGGELRGIEYLSPQASAQVKSAILLAGLQTDELVSVIEPAKSRDHTERMFKGMGVELVEETLAHGSVRVTLPAGGARKMCAQEFLIPGDFSSAAFLLVAATLIKGSSVLIRDVGFNPTRIGAFDILCRMGASIQVLNRRVVAGEEIVDLRVVSAELSGVSVSAEDVVLAIDEIPILAVAAAFAAGETVIKGAGELRVKESDRLSMMAGLLRGFGVHVEEFPDGLQIIGRPELGSGLGSSCVGTDATWRGVGDHRILMCGAIMQLVVCGEATLSGAEVVETSFPGFVGTLKKLIGTAK